MQTTNPLKDPPSIFVLLSRFSLTSTTFALLHLHRNAHNPSRRSCRSPTGAHSTPTNVYQYHSTTAHVLLIVKFRAVGVPSTNKSSVCLRYMTIEASPLYATGNCFLDPWATPCGQAVRARATFQILTLFDHASVFSIMTVRGATLMLIDCHNGVMACTLITDAVLWSLPLGPERFKPRIS